jgi:hypothetical protein
MLTVNGAKAASVKKEARRLIVVQHGCIVWHTGCFEKEPHSRTTGEEFNEGWTWSYSESMPPATFGAATDTVVVEASACEREVHVLRSNVLRTDPGDVDGDTTVVGQRCRP